MRWLIEALTVFDWITPVIETGKDVAHAVGDGREVDYFKLSSRDVGKLRDACDQVGVKVVSTAGAPFRDTIVTVAGMTPDQRMMIEQMIR